ncbi:MAG: FtsX-like permease family protein, partial [Bacteroidota bacterium]|nr:FtsX-like permease family protein [Bacteroidota bacterium]
LNLIMSFSFFVARRYRLSSTKFNTVRLISHFASFVVGVAVCAFFVIQSVFSGLHDFGLSYSSSIDPDLKINSVDSFSFIMADTVIAKLKQVKGVAVAAPIFSQEAVLRFEQQHKLVTLLGVDSRYNQLFGISDRIPVGRMVSDRGEELLLGYGTTIDLGAGLYDYDGFIECLLPKQGDINPLDPNPFVSRWATNVGVFQMSEEVDYNYAFAPLPFVWSLTNAAANAYTAVDVKLDNNAKKIALIEKIQRIIGSGFEVIEKEALNPALYRMLQTERIAIYLILSLVLTIALFNVVGAIVMMVLDKRNELQTLLGMGSSVNEIRKIFFYQGLLLSGIGGFFGLVVGIGVVVAQSIGEFILVQGTQLPYPIAFSFENLSALLLIWGVLSVVAAWVASAVVRPQLLR